MFCSKCGKQVNRLYTDKCQGCYNYYKKGGTENALPKYGEVTYDSRNYIVCHICGRAYVKLGGHIKESHNMTAKQYKEEFGLCYNSKLTEKQYSNKMREYSIANNMPNILTNLGKDSRFIKGVKGKKRRSSKQEALSRTKEVNKNVKEES